MMFAVGRFSMYLDGVCLRRGGRNPAYRRASSGGRVRATLAPFAGGPVRRLVLFAFAIGLAAAFAGLAAGPAAAKDFSITAVNIDATVRPNGDLRVHESRTLDFSGGFSFVYWDLSAKGSSGIDVTAAGGPGVDGSGNIPYEPTQDPWAKPPGTYFVSGAEPVRVQLFFSVADTSCLLYTSPSPRD